jgi:hypothetical protein
MNSQVNHKLAVARRSGLVVRDLDDEVLVYDRDRDKAHCLNRSAAAVWDRCDGRTTPAQIASMLQDEFGTPIDESFVCLALNQLSRDHLLDDEIDYSKQPPKMSRRDAVRRLGLGAAVALPLIVSITAPFPVQAATCRGSGSTCNTSSQCCSNLCACPSPPCPPTVMRCV